jgi:NTE family protein
MGSIVGGMYAAGMSVEEIEAELASIDWGEMFDDLPPRGDRSFRRKRDDELYRARFKPGFNDGKLDLPRGVIQGQKIDLEFTRLILPVASIEKFEDLTIPFRAVTADITTGEEVVLSSGNLAIAIRASMSIPAVFTPVEVDGRLLVDGGIANNLPISVVRDMGADIVIAIDIGTPLASKEEIDSVLVITSQLTGLMTRGNVAAQVATLTDTDVLIVPELDDISAGDFDEFADAIPPGREATLAQMDNLRRLALPDDAYRAYRASLYNPDAGLPVIDEIRLENNSRFSDAYIMSRVVETKTGQALDPAALERDIGGIYGLELFENVRYGISEESGNTVLTLNVDERSWGPGYLQFGIQLDSNGEGENIFNVSTTYLKTGMNPSGGEWRSGVQIGSEWALFTEFHQPFGPRYKFFVNPAIGVREQIFNAVESNDVIASFRVEEALGQLAAGREFGNWGEARIGVRYADGKAKRAIGDPDLPDAPFKRGEVFVRLSQDKLDDFNIPTSGTALFAEWLGSREGLGADTKFDQFSLLGTAAFTHKRNTFAASGLYNSTIKGTAPVQNLFTLGGFGRLSGFTSRQLAGQHSALAVLGYYRRLNSNRRNPVYAGFTLESGNVWQDRSDIALNDMIQAGSIFLGMNSIIGPIYVAYGRAEGANEALYFFIGRPL